MNERIREIERQAWEQVTRTNGLVRTEDFNQKFAELIVRDCLDVIKGESFDESNDSDPYENGYQHAVLRIQQRIEGNFGVKE
jgi:hypothetical protein